MIELELQYKVAELEKENEELMQRSCDVCDGDGWVYNRVEGRGACVCMTEAEPFQILLEALEKLADGEYLSSFYMVEETARTALRAALPLDYADRWEDQK